MKFAEIAGQIKIKNFLTTTFNNNKLSHSYLFIGKEGIGALPIAIAFAQYINCKYINKELNDSCGECENCIKISNIEHPDIHYTYPVINNSIYSSPISINFIKEWQNFILQNPYNNTFDWFNSIGNNKNENKQGNIFVHEINFILQKLLLKSFEAKYKIQIIWMAEYLKTEGNKLLKILEEPPQNTIFLLIAENKDNILNTILSRVQLINLDILSDKEIQNYLINKNYELNKINHILHLAEGNIRKAIILLSEDVELNFLLIKKMLNVVFIGKTTSYIEWISDITKHGKEFIKQYLIYALSIIQNSYKKYFIENSEDNDYDKLLKIISDKIEIENLFISIQIIEKTIFYIERNSNEQLTLHTMLINLNSIIKNKIHLQLL